MVFREMDAEKLSPKPVPWGSLTSFCLWAAAATPAFYVATQIAAAPFYPGFNSSLSVSMLGTRFSRQPWIFNTGEVLTGLAALAGAFGLYRSFRARTHLLAGLVVAFAVASSGIMTVKAGLFPLPDPRHNSWSLLFVGTILIPFVMLIGLLQERRSRGLRIYLALSITFLLLLIPWIPRLGRGTVQRLIAAGTLLPVGVIGFSFWREFARNCPERPDRISSAACGRSA